MAVSLCACNTQDAGDTTSLALQDDANYVLQVEENEETALDGGGATIALAVDSDGVESGMNAMLWLGVQQFCTTFNFSAQLFEAEGEGVEANEEVLRKAAESAVCAFYHENTLVVHVNCLFGRIFTNAGVSKRIAFLCRNRTHICNA